MSANGALRMPDDDAAAIRCRRCRDRIGSYEPMVVVTHDAVRRTSRLAVDADRLPGAACYHAACWEGAA